MAQIQTKSEIIQELEAAWLSVIHQCRQQPDEHFATPIAPGKWSTAQNIEHLCSSTFPLAKGLATPKLILRMTIGVNNRTEKTLEGLYEKYKSVLATGVKAPAKFEPKVFSNEQKEELLNKFAYAKEKLIKVLDKWNEKDMTKYILPHPAIGKLTVREMLFFTIFHTHHHLDTIKLLKV